MCHYITLISNCPDIGALAEVMERHGRCATAIVNASIQGVSLANERQYYTTRTCDCGTVLARRERPGKDKSKLIERKSKAGWSKAKIERWLQSQERGAGRPDQGGDSHELWQNIIREVLSVEGTSTAGLIVHQYEGGLSEEVFQTSRRETRSRDDLATVLQSMREDELLVFRRGSKT